MNMIGLQEKMRITGTNGLKESRGCTNGYKMKKIRD